MKRIMLTMAAVLCFVFVPAACGTAPEPAQTNQAQAADIVHQIQYRFADREEGQKLLLSNTEYYDGFTENDLQFRMQSRDAAMKDYLAFAEDQVRDFTDKQKALISGTMDQIELTAAENGYQFPPLDEITFISTTTDEEPGAAAYTHGTQIYLNEAFMDMCTKHKKYGADFQRLLAHEVFHCLTRCNPAFRADMYALIHFTVQDEEYKLPASVSEYYISNPDVEHHNAFATFNIDGKPVDCYMAFATREHFEKAGDTFFDTGTAVLVPVDGTDTYYYPEDASNYSEVLGENTEYTIDPEECMADNFSYLITYGEDGPRGKGYQTPEIIDGIRDYLQK